MLDTDTKRRIDTARDILVGKVPDPKSQVEQITIALIYKFMDDMDAESEEFGGQRKFFTDEFSRYGWAKLMRSGLGGHETLNLYAEAIAKMPENPGIPLLFREIFKNAYLPYRDPETLRAFLKIIDEFEYDHSERLGDAFEYLLSVLGSQGDAGQFRTPRHIIDFIVAIINPKKNETVLDPACGTAGFLISSYKHIQRANTDANGNSTLTPDDKGHIAQNFRGYDISPDMVRLSLVNLYLHGFSDPHIYEYDTLTSDERWNEYFDVILANPPFMSPKGGIRPHNRFSVQSKRSEVLFVDYMAEHLTPAGSAGIIVPEGIIFQSQTAYRDLRQMLVENYLVAVISLPAGVFNPYSGVKTSILILDKSLAKQSKSIAFFRVDNDGFGLGAQRRATERNDLPQTKAQLDVFLNALRDQHPIEELNLTLGQIVTKEDIGKNGDYNLSGERYGADEVDTAAWPLVPLGVVTRRVSGGTPSKENSSFWSGSIPWVSPKDMKVAEIYDTEDHVTEEALRASAANVVPSGTLLCVVRSGILKHSLPLALTMREMCFNQDIIALIPIDGRLDARFLFSVLRGKSQEILERGIKPGVTVQSLHNGFFDNFQIPLPPLDVQNKIVSEIKGYQKVIDGARTVIDNYRPRIPIHPDWPLVTIGDLVANERYSLKAGPFGSSLKKDSYVESGYKVYGQEQVIRGDVNFGDYYISEEKFRELESCKVKAGDVLISLVGTYGKVLIVPENHAPGIINPRLLKVTFDKVKILPSYFVEAFRQDAVTAQVANLSYGGTMGILSLKVLKNLKIPLPPLGTQQQIVDEIEAEQALVTANRELIERFEHKIQATIARVWGEGKHTPMEA